MIIVVTIMIIIMTTTIVLMIILADEFIVYCCIKCDVTHRPKIKHVIKFCHPAVVYQQIQNFHFVSSHNTNCSNRLSNVSCTVNEINPLFHIYK